LEEGIEAFSHRGIKQKKGKKSHPQIAQIERRLFKRKDRKWLVFFDCGRTSCGSPSANSSAREGDMKKALSRKNKREHPQITQITRIRKEEEKVERLRRLFLWIPASTPPRFAAQNSRFIAPE